MPHKTGCAMNQSFLSRDNNDLLFSTIPKEFEEFYEDANIVSADLEPALFDGDPTGEMFGDPIGEARGELDSEYNGIALISLVS